MLKRRLEMKKRREQIAKQKEDDRIARQQARDTKINRAVMSFWDILVGWFEQTRARGPGTLEAHMQVFCTPNRQQIYDLSSYDSARFQYLQSEQHMASGCTNSKGCKEHFHPRTAMIKYLWNEYYAGNLTFEGYETIMLESARFNITTTDENKRLKKFTDNHTTRWQIAYHCCGVRLFELDDDMAEVHYLQDEDYIALEAHPEWPRTTMRTDEIIKRTS
jgi:hypothetical protein